MEVGKYNILTVLIMRINKVATMYNGLLPKLTSLINIFPVYITAFSRSEQIPELIHFSLLAPPYICVVGDSPMTRIMDLPNGYINQELSW